MAKCCIILLLVWVQSTQAQVRGSYHRLKGRDLSRFTKTKGASAKGQSIALVVPGSIFPAKASSRSRRVACSFKGVRIEIATNNPYWLQTKRKLAKSSSGKVLVKGRVRRRKSRGNTLSYYLYVDTLQKVGRAKRRGKKKKKR